MSDGVQNTDSQIGSTEFVDWAVFLRDFPPGSTARIRDLIDGPSAELYVPELRLFCDSRHCGEQTAFALGTQTILQPNEVNKAVSCSQVAGRSLMSAPGLEWIEALLQYYCRRCRKPLKLYAFRVGRLDTSGLKGRAVKFGEWPTFAPRVPSRLMTLIGPDRELFLKGRRAEMDGLGIGAFSYYRRVIENQKNRMLDEIIRVAERRNAKAELIESLRRAKGETQFSKALNDVKDAIPDVLRIKGHNPLTLLHKALSEGLHASSDQECLGIAGSIRIIMGELAEQMAEALRDQQGLDKALNRLVNAPNA